MSNRASKQPSVLDQNLLLCKLQLCRNRCLINLTLNQIFAMLKINNKEFLEKWYHLLDFHGRKYRLLGRGYIRTGLQVHESALIPQVSEFSQFADLWVISWGEQGWILWLDKLKQYWFLLERCLTDILPHYLLFPSINALLRPNTPNGKIHRIFQRSSSTKVSVWDKKK